MISLIRGMKKRGRIMKRIMTKMRGVTSGLIHAMRRMRTTMATGAGINRSGVEVIVRMKAIIAGEKAAMAIASGRPVAVAGLPRVSGGGLLPVIGGDLRRWTVTGCGRSPVKGEGRITRREARTGMMKADGAGLLPTVDGRLPTGGILHRIGDVLLPAGVIRVLHREAAVRVAPPGMRAGSLRAAAGDRVTGGVVVRAAAVPVGVERVESVDPNSN